MIWMLSYSYSSSIEAKSMMYLGRFLSFSMFCSRRKCSWMLRRSFSSRPNSFQFSSRSQVDRSKSTAYSSVSAFRCISSIRSGFSLISLADLAETRKKLGNVLPLKVLFVDEMRILTQSFLQCFAILGSKWDQWLSESACALSKTQSKSDFLRIDVTGFDLPSSSDFKEAVSSWFSVSALQSESRLDNRSLNAFLDVILAKSTNRILKVNLFLRWK
jgi:hypothetical protein